MKTVVNKKTGKDITKHLLDYMEGKIDKKKFEKLTGLKKESVKEVHWFERRDRCITKSRSKNK